MILIGLDPALKCVLKAGHQLQAAGLAQRGPAAPQGGNGTLQLGVGTIGVSAVDGAVRAGRGNRGEGGAHHRGENGRRGENGDRGNRGEGGGHGRGENGRRGENGDRGENGGHCGRSTPDLAQPGRGLTEVGQNTRKDVFGAGRGAGPSSSSQRSDVKRLFLEQAACEMLDELKEIMKSDHRQLELKALFSPNFPDVHIRFSREVSLAFGSRNVWRPQTLFNARLVVLVIEG